MLCTRAFPARHFPHIDDGYKVEHPEADAYDFARQWIGGFKGQYDDSDYEADVAAVNIAWLLANGGQATVAGAFRSPMDRPEPGLNSFIV
ncbi:MULTISPECIES: hypothetical protein [unclassified Cryobacterium]|uniref:hypothetical protein n=1 Tax=unclassified Cryobacterium TaxID=2649013 RepID=UPI00106BB470|nr:MULTISPECIES: hypothetical protein [unclassified Cryobacterium]TFC56806.1 hypothetical protein E3O60_16765 [Cryobacterium sp. TMB1-7]TFC57895.1 hypothetical protein E3O68_02480 [Cryobacterium sp. TMB3-1-2]TFC70106.1 hypothetical protein E3T21_11095 [Cryobacterium sp. TMB3-15]TFC75476.1 hypothetical protein E3T22_12715 [Cryobacterium sp. TMB3-10]TFD38843.1 hypothetical protein E3T58_16155 [Cryobacterium sp. TMB3-12]